MSKTINTRGYYDHELWRVWPDGTVQHTDEPAHSHMSDDYVVVWAYSEAEALSIAAGEGYV